MSPIEITLPPPVVGDPAGMRALAALLRGTAADIAETGADVSGTVKGMVFEGPAATAFRERVDALGSRLDAAAAELQSLAATLETAATQVEAEQRAREQKVQQLLELRAELARAAARS